MKNLNITNKKLSEYSNKEFKSNLKKWYNFATAEQKYRGTKWYEDAQKFTEIVAVHFKLDPYIVATIISCLSPNNKWETNKENTFFTLHFHELNPNATEEEYLKNVKCSTYFNNRKKAWRALKQGKEIQKTAPKTHAFAMNIGLNSGEHITIDKWHLRACQVSPKADPQNLQESCTALQYRNIERITAEIAKEKGLKGYELQAIIWLTIKAKWER